MKATLYFDGGSRGNPGPAAGAAMLTIGADQHPVSSFLAHATNNEAEYTGLLLGLKKAIEVGVREIEIFGDSDLVVKQVTGRWKCQKEHLRPLLREAKQLLKAFDKWSLNWVRREQNKQADQLCNACMDEQSGVKRSDKQRARNTHPSGDNRIDSLNKKGPSAGFKEWVALKVPNGRDAYTGMRLPKLAELISNEAVEEIQRIWLEQCQINRQAQEFSDTDRAKCYRWHLRGLIPECAVRKVRVDMEVTANCVH